MGDSCLVSVLYIAVSVLPKLGFLKKSWLFWPCKKKLTRGQRGTGVLNVWQFPTLAKKKPPNGGKTVLKLFPKGGY